MSLPTEALAKPYWGGKRPRALPEWEAPGSGPRLIHGYGPGPGQGALSKAGLSAGPMLQMRKAQAWEVAPLRQAGPAGRARAGNKARGHRWAMLHTRVFTPHLLPKSVCHILGPALQQLR